MKDLLEGAFHQAVDAYKNNLNRFWPTFGSRGITESNQVYQFCKAAELLQPGLFSYLEVPFGKEGWIDGMIVNLTDERPKLVLIEAKRIKEGGYGAAYEEIKRDSIRLTCDQHLENLPDRFMERGTHEELEIFFVYLADVWVGGKKRSHEVIPEWKTNKLFPGWANCQTFESEPLEFTDSTAKYHLLMAFSSSKKRIPIQPK